MPRLKLNRFNAFCAIWLAWCSLSWCAWADCKRLQESFAQSNSTSGGLFPHQKYPDLHRLETGWNLYRYVTVDGQQLLSREAIIDFQAPRDGAQSDRVQRIRQLILDQGSKAFDHLMTQQALVGFNRTTPRLTLPASETTEGFYFAKPNQTGPLSIKLLGRFQKSSEMPVLSWRKSDVESTEVGLVMAPSPQDITWYILVQERNPATGIAETAYRIHDMEKLGQSLAGAVVPEGAAARTEAVVAWARQQVEAGTISYDPFANVLIDFEARMALPRQLLNQGTETTERAHELLNYLASKVSDLTPYLERSEARQALTIILEGLEVYSAFRSSQKGSDAGVRKILEDPAVSAKLDKTLAIYRRLVTINGGAEGR